MKIIEAILAQLALWSAQSGAGLASSWNAYQPKEPKNIKNNK